MGRQDKRRYPVPLFIAVPLIMLGGFLLGIELLGSADSWVNGANYLYPNASYSMNVNVTGNFSLDGIGTIQGSRICTSANGLCSSGVPGTNGTNGLNGTSLTLNTIGNLGNGSYQWNFSSGFNYTTGNLTGAKGSIGLTGAQGVQGNPGVDGSNGTNGFTLAQIVANVGNWSRDSQSGLNNLSLRNVSDNIGNWTNDKGSYTLLSQLVGGVGQNLTHALIVVAEGNWSLDKSGYYTITSVNSIENGQNNFSLSQMVSNFGNWTLDKTSYSTSAQAALLYYPRDTNPQGFFNSSNDGPGSGLDADTLDGINSSGFLQVAGFSANNITSGTVPVNRLPLNNISFLPAYTDFIFLTGATTGSFSTADTVGRCTTFKIDFSDQAVFNNITLWVQTINNSVGVYFGIYNCTAGNAVNCTSGSLLINATTTTTTNRTGLVGFQNLTGSWTLPSGTYLSCMTSNFSNAIAVYRAATSTTGMPGTCSFSTKGGGMPTTAVLNCTAGNPAFTWLYS